MTALNSSLADADDAAAECACRAWAEVAAATISRLTAERDTWRARAHDLAVIVAEAGHGRPAKLDAAVDLVRRLHDRGPCPGDATEARSGAGSGDEPGASVSGEGPVDSGRSQTYKCVQGTIEPAANSEDQDA